jgi:hypothetical protein
MNRNSGGSARRKRQRLQQNTRSIIRDIFRVPLYPIACTQAGGHLVSADEVVEDNAADGVVDESDGYIVDDNSGSNSPTHDIENEETVSHTESRPEIPRPESRISNASDEVRVIESEPEFCSPPSSESSSDSESESDDEEAT